MNTDKNLQFIADRIADTGIALMHCHNNSVLKIPSHVVATHKVDSDGYIWFFIPRPKQLVSQFEKEFPVNLHYFKKGNAYSLNIYGKASIICDPEQLATLELTPDEQEMALNQQLLVCVKMLKVDYYDHEPERTASFLDRVKALLYELVNWAETGNRSFEFGARQGMPSI